MTWLLAVSAVFYVFGSSRILIFAIGFVLQSVYLLQRSLSLGRLPLLGPHDTLTFFALSIAVMALITSCAHSARRTRWFMIASGISAGLLTLCALRFKPLNMPLPQILDTLWFELHVVLAFSATTCSSWGGCLVPRF